MKRLLTIQDLSQKNPKWVHKDIFRILNKDDIWKTAYEKLKGNKNPETIDGRALERLQRLKEKVCSEQYQFTLVKRKYISQAKEKVPLSLKSDKIVQEVMRMILEAIYEPVFYDISFGFQRGLGCHDALAHVEQKFRWVDYVIEGVTTTIDHHTLVKILKKRIDDARFIRLVWKLIGCGVLDQESIKWSPQSNIISPLLANIYYHELDSLVKSFKYKHETPQTEKFLLEREASKNLEYRSFSSDGCEARIRKVYQKPLAPLRSQEIESHESQTLEHRVLAKELKTLQNKRFQTNPLKNKGIRIEYVRYEDNWMIGISGCRKLVIQLHKEIHCFLKNYLVQKLHPIKTKIIDLRKGNAHFLGYEIFLPRNRTIPSDKGKRVGTSRIGQPQLRFDLPVAKITNRLESRGYLKQMKNKIRPISKASYTVFEDHVIVSHYRSVWLGLLNYYSGCTNRGRLQYIHYLLHMSCAMSLGHRHRMSCSKIFAKHGKGLTVKIPYTDKTVSFPYKTTWKVSERKWLLGRVYLPIC